MPVLNRSDIVDDSLIPYLNEVRASLEGIIATGQKSGAAIQGAGSTAKIKQEVDQMTESEKQLAKVTQQLVTIQAKNNEAYIAQQKAVNSANQALKQRSELGDRDVKTINAQNASIKQLEISLKANREAYKALTTEEARNSKEGQALLKIIKEQDAAVKKLNGEIGDHRDNVGDYEGAMKRLKAELKLAKDELVVIGQTLGADSEEFKIAAEKAGQLTDEIGDLNDATKAVSGGPFENLGNIFGQVTGKLRNLDFKGASESAGQFAKASKQITFKQATSELGGLGKTLVQVGKAILTNPLFILTAVIVGISVALISLRDKIAPVRMAFEFAGQAVDFVIQKLKDFLDFLGLTTFAADEKADKIISAAQREIDFINSRYDDEIAVAASAGKDVYDLEVKKQKDIIKAATAGINSLFTLQKNQGGKLNEEQKGQLNAFVDAYAKSVQQIQILENNKNKELERKRKEAFLKEQGDLFKLQQFRLQVAIEDQKLIAENSKMSQSARVEAAGKEIELRKKLAQLVRQNALKEENLTTSAKKLIEAQYQESLKDITREGQQQVAAINKEIADKEEEERKKRLERAKQMAQKEVDIVQRALDTEVMAIQQAAIDGLVSREEAEKAIQEVLKKGADDVINAQIKSLQDVLAAEKLTADERAEIEKQLYKLKVDLQDAYFNAIADKEKSSLERTRENLEKLSGLYQDFASGVTDLFAAFTERRLQSIDEDEKRNDETRESELEKEDEFLQGQLANETLTEEQKAQIQEQSDIRKANIEKQAEARQEAIDKRRRDAQTRQARLDKVAALIGAAINTALAVTKVIGQGGIFGIPLVPIVAALGAIQIAAIAAQPIPKYALGTDNHKGGLAILGDGGGSEMFITPDGKIGMSPDTDTVMDLPRGTQVIPHDETMRRLAFTGMSSSNTRGDSSDVIAKGFKSLERTIRNEPKHIITGKITGSKRAGTRVNYIESLRNR